MSSTVRTFWSTTSAPTFLSFNERIVPITSCTTLGASPWLGSSKRTRPGPPASAREIETICNSPPDMFSHSLASRLRSAGKISQHASVEYAGNGDGPRAIDRLRAAVNVGNTRRSSGTHLIPSRAIRCVGQRVTSRSRHSTAPARAGVFELRGGKTTVRMEPGVTATVDGNPVDARELRPDVPGPADVLKLGPRLTLHVIERGGRYGIRLKDRESALLKEFTGLRWFPVQEDYRVEARFVPYASPKKIAVPNILGQVEELPSPGYAAFTIGGREVRLDPVLEEPGAKELFFIFRDQTTGKETYPAGRFLYAPMPEDGRVTLDFNKAYSPPCAFTPYATCPLPPRQNRLPVRIEAGEMSTGKPHSRP